MKIETRTGNAVSSCPAGSRQDDLSSTVSLSMQIPGTGAEMGKEKVTQPNKKEKVLKNEIIYEGKAFGVRRDELIEPTGVHTIRQGVTHPGSVVIMPLLPDGRIVLLRQHHHAARQYLLDLV